MFILKLLTILFFLYTLSNLFVQHKFLKEQATKAYTELKEIILKKNTTILEDNDYMTKPNILYVAVLSIITWIIYAIEILYIAFSIKHDPYKYIIIGYLIFWILMLIKANINGVRQPKLKTLNVESAIEYLDKQIDKVNKTTVWQIIQSLIDVIFYVYMIYIFFIK